ncbi:MAG: hypothetical protein EOP02_33290, partial [Proteobacteria bacterium]
MPVIAAHRSLPLTAHPLLPELNVLSGPHAGAVVALESSVCRIGAHEDCDIVLRDPQIHATHLTVHVHRQAATVALAQGNAHIADHDIAAGGLDRQEAPVHMHGEVGCMDLGVAQDDVAVFMG